MNTSTTKSTHGNQIITEFKLYGLKELIILRKIIQDRMNDTREHYDHDDILEYLTLGQILIRLPEPALLTPQVCTERDIQR